jgi:hypothetical protein
MTKNGLASNDASSSHAEDGQPPSKKIKLSGTTTTADSASTLAMAEQQELSSSTPIKETTNVENQDIKMNDQVEDTKETVPEQAPEKEEGKTEEQPQPQQEGGRVLSEEEQKEIKAGITQYVDAELDGFQGILKQRSGLRSWCLRHLRRTFADIVDLLGIPTF